MQAHKQAQLLRPLRPRIVYGQHLPLSDMPAHVADKRHKVRKAIFVIYVFFCFYGVPRIAAYLLPKWVGILIGVPLSFFLIYKGAIFYMDLDERRAVKERKKLPNRTIEI